MGGEGAVGILISPSPILVNILDVSAKKGEAKHKRRKRQRTMKHKVWGPESFCYHWKLNNPKLTIIVYQ